jgi:hypothetical protein
MKCKECGLGVCVPDKSRTYPSERTFPGYPFHAKDAFGSWFFPHKEISHPLCSYHRRKAEGHFSRGEEYYRLNEGPNEWTKPCERYYPKLANTSIFLTRGDD